MSVFVHDQGIKNVHAGWVGQKWQTSVYVVVECPLKQNTYYMFVILGRKKLFDK